ncbi:hypothetical protein B0H19DRAFT_1272462 [Mycena capillaripes]|nr:hypothetical protein B0H19DRAFT_1272462 [Mycena capillaripes]
MAVECSIIPPNPDVSGVGISKDELKGIKDQSIGMLAVAFAILLTTIILAKGAGGDQSITNYHAAVVLDLSWMNNTSTWIWFILYVHIEPKAMNQFKRTGVIGTTLFSHLSRSCCRGRRELVVTVFFSAFVALSTASGILSPGSLS